MVKPSWIKQIRVLVWDLDGTLYENDPELQDKIYQNILSLVGRYQKTSKTQAEIIFNKTYAKTGSSTQSMLDLGVNKELVLSGKWYAEAQLKGIKKDLKLIKMFGQLLHLTNIINTNGEGQATLQKLQKLGLNPDLFAHIICNSELGKLKPELFPFQYTVRLTKQRSERHLFIGDRVETDIIPAKKSGMKTCLVWKKSSQADLSLKTVYEVANLFKN